MSLILNDNSQNQAGNQTTDESTIQQLEFYIRDFWRFLPLPICYVSPLHLILDAGQEMQKFSKYSAEEIIGERVDSIFSDPVEQLKILEKDIMEKGVVIGKKMHLLTKDKEQIPVNVFAMARRDENNESIGYFLALYDIRETEKMQATLELKVKARTKELEDSKTALMNMLADIKEARDEAEEEQKKTAAIISNLIDPIIVLDQKNKISLFNPVAKDVLGLGSKDLGKKISSQDSYTMDNFKKVIKKKFNIKKIYETGKKKIIYEELIVNYRKQNDIYKVITAKILGHRREYLGVMKIFYNVTREKVLDQMKSEFISIAAHQLRTPLSAIKWAIKMVFDGECGALNQEQKEMLSKGYDSNERIIRLVNDMLDASRIEEGRFGYSFINGKIEDALAIVLDNLDQMIKERNIKININQPAGLPTVLLDKDKIILVLQNILENAVKYTPANGKIEIDIKLLDNNLIVKVKDNGVGIPKEDQPKLFSKFFRANNVIRMQTEGSGLGLFICKNIIEAHGGKISYTSQEGKGTEFVFSLPLEKSKKLKAVNN